GMLSFVFFFQAEDGIRDDLVTGVQTCALPISVVTTTAQAPSTIPEAFPAVTMPSLPKAGASVASDSTVESGVMWSSRSTSDVFRSEERRVGKECGSRGTADRLERTRR